MNGSKRDTEAVGCTNLRIRAAVGERWWSDTSRTVRSDVGATR